MNEKYLICVKRDHDADYCIPLIGSLKDLDQITLTANGINVRKLILEQLKHNDNTLKEEDYHRVYIKKLINGKYIKEKYTDIVEDPFILTFPLEKLFEDDKEGTRICHIMYNYFQTLLVKDYIRDTFKDVICSMNVGPKAFLNKMDLMSYDEKRMVRVYLGTHIDIHHILDKVMQLTRTIEVIH